MRCARAPPRASSSPARSSTPSQLADARRQQQRIDEQIADRHHDPGRRARRRDRRRRRHRRLDRARAPRPSPASRAHSPTQLHPRARRPTDRRERRLLASVTWSRRPPSRCGCCAPRRPGRSRKPCAPLPRPTRRRPIRPARRPGPPGPAGKARARPARPVALHRGLQRTSPAAASTLVFGAARPDAGGLRKRLV